ncbi:hypothetical protein NPIL_350601 [Nephila pilipes]|uniref:Uncharacterized protein n=1 Tax=Nephila pilipes TaxID=299642 RepID=A0A8X6MCK1_NEPPI|nr:hypothetical protein NPIL_350601 [Nephila pilipes]
MTGLWKSRRHQYLQFNIYNRKSSQINKRFSDPYDKFEVKFRSCRKPADCASHCQTHSDHVIILTRAARWAAQHRGAPRFLQMN